MNMFEKDIFMFDKFICFELFHSNFISLVLRE